MYKECLLRKLLKKIKLPGEKKERTVYIGPKGGRYIKKGGEFVLLPKGMKGGVWLFGNKGDKYKVVEDTFEKSNNINYVDEGYSVVYVL